MKDIPENYKFLSSHEWARLEEDGIVTVGISDYAQDQLGDIVYLELPQTGSVVKQLDKMGEIESVKAVSDLFSPISGNVIESNSDLDDHPELVNEDPFGKGWLIRVTMTSVNELDGLMAASEYQSYIDGL